MTIDLYGGEFRARNLNKIGKSLGSETTETAANRKLPLPSRESGRVFYLVGKMLKIGFIGAGKVGTALAILLNEKGYRFMGASRLSKTTAATATNLHLLESNQAVADAADLVFITTPDAAIGKVAAEVRWHKGQGVVHCSGADSTAILEPARLAGALVGGFHPLQTFAGVKEAIENIPGTTFAIEAAEPLLSTLKQMSEDLGGSWITLGPQDKAAYHAAAVFASNYLVTLVKMAADLWNTFSVPTDQATKALLPLLRGTLHNIETLGIPDCLTGPIARGDSGTVSKHLDTLRQKAPALLMPYKELGRQTVPVSLAKGKIDQSRADELLAILK
jgi:predicted short-subunit dehydrogenase-like oxidoreductase (DUF2520 family)